MSKNKPNSKVDPYFLDGCGRCPLVGTDNCKARKWQEELLLMRGLLLDAGLTEELKWGVPCYTFEDSNVILLGAFKEYASLMFIKGSLLKDEQGILVQQTENVQASRQFRCTSVQDIVAAADTLKAYIQEAIDIEKSGKKVAYKKTEEFDFPEELQQKMAEMPELKKAFEALTPGRQRGYLLHFSQAKQSKTRIARIEKCMQAILDGKGLND